MKQIFGRGHRLCRSKDFHSIFRRGNIFRRPCCKVYAYPNTLTHGRLGVIISKKTIPLSTGRHHFKRVVRESFRLNPERLAGCDVIVMIKLRFLNKAELWSELDSVWQEINRWRCTS